MRKRQIIWRRSSLWSTRTDWCTGGCQSDSRSLTAQWTLRGFLWTRRTVLLFTSLGQCTVHSSTSQPLEPVAVDLIYYQNSGEWHLVGNDTSFDRLLLLFFLFLCSFFPAPRYASAGLSNVSVCLSVCPSVRLSHAGIVSNVMISSLPGSPTILIF